MMIDKVRLKSQLIVWAEELSLSIAFTRPSIPIEDQQRLRQWLADGYHGDMRFMMDNLALRDDPQQLLPETLTVISAKINYWSEPFEKSFEQLRDSHQGYISRYALGRDYHKVLRQRLKQLCLKIESEVGHFNWRPFTDSAPIMEHSLAHQAGLGFIGKHSLMIHPKEGSTFFLGQILCDLDLVEDNDHIAPMKSGCGPCKACITHCPTQAIVAPFTVDARRCISYLTIEYKGSIDPELRPLMGNRIYGCDDCQLVCPWNKYTQSTKITDFIPRHGLDNVSLLALWQWSEKDFLYKTEGSPIRRIGYSQWRRNLAIALGNAQPHAHILSALIDALSEADSLVREHIEWAIDRQS